jgi:hypothetical protein
MLISCLPHLKLPVDPLLSQQAPVMIIVVQDGLRHPGPMLLPQPLPPPQVTALVPHGLPPPQVTALVLHGPPPQVTVLVPHHTLPQVTALVAQAGAITITTAVFSVRYKLLGCVLDINYFDRMCGFFW